MANRKLFLQAKQKDKVKVKVPPLLQNCQTSPTEQEWHTVNTRNKRNDERCYLLVQGLYFSIAYIHTLHRLDCANK